jgi:type IV secretory pathway VirD2 relaxase
MFEKQPFSARNALREAKADEFRGRMLRARKGGSNGGANISFGKQLGAAIAGKKVGRGGGPGRGSRPFAVDGRQRAVAKVSFRSHFARGGGGGGGGGNLAVHASYLQRDGAEREGEKGRFYDAREDEVRDVGERLEEWAQADMRHFRIMLAPESGARLVAEDGHLKDFTRETTVRGVRRDGADLILPRDYVSHGLREAARDVATDRLGARGRDDERLRLDREAHARGYNRLDQAIEHELGDKSEILLQRLGKRRDPAFADALKARARELARIGLACETRRNVLAFERDWTERLKSMKAIDVRRELAQARLYEKSMGRVAGAVRELGPRGETPDRGVLVIETPEKGRLVLNTSMERIADLQRGSLVEVKPEGRRGEIERLSFHSSEEQVHARAQTELDREIDRLARGESPRLPATPEVKGAMDERAWVLESHRLGLRGADGRFHFREGALDELKQTELSREGREATKERHGLFRDVTPKAGRSDGRDGFGGEDAWQVRDTKELFAGRTAILERGRDVALAPVKPGMSLGPGDHVALNLSNAVTKTPHLEITKLLGRGLGLER